MEFFFSARLQADGLQLYQKHNPLQIFFKSLLRFVAIYKEFLDILENFISQSTYYSWLLTFASFSKYLFPKLQYIFSARDYGLRKPTMLNVVKMLNVKFTAIYSKTCPITLFYIQQRCIQNPIKRQDRAFRETS